jgi:predicted MFS family arabinose efflux permease
MKNVSWKTTAFGIGLGIAFGSLLVGFLLKLYSATDFSVAMAAVSAVAFPLWGMLQKDKDKTGLPNS